MQAWRAIWRSGLTPTRRRQQFPGSNNGANRPFQTHAAPAGVTPASSVIKILLVLFIACAIYMQMRGRVRHPWYKQAFDHSSFTAPINVLMLALSGTPRTPYIETSRFAELRVLEENWQVIRGEGEALLAAQIKASKDSDDAGLIPFSRPAGSAFTSNGMARRILRRACCVRAPLKSFRSCLQ
jgi:hypothetical protein